MRLPKRASYCKQAYTESLRRLFCFCSDYLYSQRMRRMLEISVAVGSNLELLFVCVCVCFVIICVNLQITCFLPFFESFSASVFSSCASSHLLLGLPSSLSVCSFVYETEHFNGVAELLEILGRYVGGLWASDTHLHSALLLLMLLAWVTETWERQQNSTQLCYLAVVL